MAGSGGEASWAAAPVAAGPVAAGPVAAGPVAEVLVVAPAGLAATALHNPQASATAASW